MQYAPSRGRFKVYLIDEVHMLSSHSFNALLKTLEEPPPYVKFILATTEIYTLSLHDALPILRQQLDFVGFQRRMNPHDHADRAAGVVNLYSRDFYQLAAQRLQPQGIVAQWLPLPTQNIDDSRSLVRSFLDVFPYATLWSSEFHEMLLVGSLQPIELDAARINARFEQPGVRSAVFMTVSMSALDQTPQFMLVAFLPLRET